MLPNMFFPGRGFPPTPPPPNPEQIQRRSTTLTIGITAGVAVLAAIGAAFFLRRR